MCVTACTASLKSLTAAILKWDPPHPTPPDGSEWAYSFRIEINNETGGKLLRTRGIIEKGYPECTLSDKAYMGTPASHSSSSI